MTKFVEYRCLRSFRSSNSNWIQLAKWACLWIYLHLPLWNYYSRTTMSPAYTRFLGRCGSRQDLLGMLSYHLRSPCFITVKTTVLRLDPPRKVGQSTATPRTFGQIRSFASGWRRRPQGSEIGVVKIRVWFSRFPRRLRPSSSKQCAVLTCNLVAPIEIFLRMSQRWSMWDLIMIPGKALASVLYTA